jgi:serine/threonine protein kinase
MISVVKHLHDVGVAHRDLKASVSFGRVCLSDAQKPENFLCVNKLPSSPIKLIDFGFAKAVVDVLATPVYTPYYVGLFLDTALPTLTLSAPEILHVRSRAATSYSKGCDIWSLGVILYIMCVIMKLSDRLLILL